MTADARVIAVHRQALHRFSKDTVEAIELVAGHGVRDDAHFGVTVKHRSRVARDPTQPNLRQVHLLQAEWLDEAAARGHAVAPGAMGENVTVRGLDLLALATGTRLRLGASALIEVTGLRNPCRQIDHFQPGLLAVALGRAADGSPVRKAGVMAVVIEGGRVAAGDAVSIASLPAERRPLVPV